MTKISYTNNEFIELRQSVESTYKEIGKVRCPYLDSNIAFNTKGLDHLKFKTWNKARSRNDQFMRLRLINLAPEVIKKSHTIQGLSSGNRFERVKVNNRWEQKMIFVTYYEFIAVIKNCRVRIVVEQVESSEPYFWSIIPYWKQGNYGKKMFEGNPEED